MRLNFLSVLPMAAHLPPILQIRIGDRDFVVRQVVPGDRGNVLALHERVFGPGANPAWFAWKYGQDKGEGNGFAMGAWCDGEMIAHCGAVPRVLLRNGHAVPGMQVGDVMVDARWRGLLTRRGPFFQVSQALYGHGLDINGIRQVAYGFPNGRHLKLALKLDLVWSGGPMHALHWHVEDPAPPQSTWWRRIPVESRADVLDLAISRAWSAMQADFETTSLAARDAAYVRWRYTARPDQRCEFWLLRRPWARHAAGVIVLKRTGDDMHWIDWIGPRGLMTTACLEARSAATEAGCSRLFAWASPVVVETLAPTRFEDRGIVAWLSYSRASGLTETDVHGSHWWWMGGDTDFL